MDTYIYQKAPNMLLFLTAVFVPLKPVFATTGSFGLWRVREFGALFDECAALEGQNPAPPLGA